MKGKYNAPEEKLRKKGESVMNTIANNRNKINENKEEFKMNTTSNNKADNQNKNSENKEEFKMNTTINNEANNNAEAKARNIVLVQPIKEKPGMFDCRVINTKGLSVCPPLECEESSLSVLSMVFSTDICNFRIVDGKFVKGWTESAMDALEEFVKNVHESCLKENPGAENGFDYPETDDDDDETCWDEGIPERERVTNPSSAEIEERMKELISKNKAGKTE